MSGWPKDYALSATVHCALYCTITPDGSIVRALTTGTAAKHRRLLVAQYDKGLTYYMQAGGSHGFRSHICQTIEWVTCIWVSQTPGSSAVHQVSHIPSGGSQGIRSEIEITRIYRPIIFHEVCCLPKFRSHLWRQWQCGSSPGFRPHVNMQAGGSTWYRPPIVKAVCCPTRIKASFILGPPKVS